MKLKIKSSGKKYESGATLVEYGLLVALIAIIALPSVIAVGRNSKCTMYMADAASRITQDSDGTYRYTSNGGFYTRSGEASINSLITYIKGRCTANALPGIFR